MDQARRLERLRWARPALALASVILTLGILEIGSRLIGTARGPAQALQIGSLRLFGRYDPLLFWSLEPGKAMADGRLWVNAQGFRGPEVADKQPGEYRILSLGESTTFAAQLPYADSYSAVLERKLGARDGGAEVRVINAGVPGYSLFQGYVFLRDRSAALQPDLVLLYFGYNDFLPVAYLAERAFGSARPRDGRNDWELFEHRRRPLQRATSWLMLHSNLYRGLAARVSRQSSERLGQSERRPRVPAAHRQRLLELAKAYTDSNGIELVIVVPVYRDFEEHAELLRSFAERESVAVVDLPTLLEAQLAGKGDRYFLDPIHPSPRGHRLIAEAIFDVIAPEVPTRRR